ncbi:hypothetical protein T440DRAFT_480940 [Plenodomus tracheiphilus IPT5]|uniref:Uncharacterized protein n=1 Tax=Plenodomus tracheiphilus IPT5 TaxID=1408161 RepID=A0A6A7AYZ4_9PLEO|nr:hypothetical protein T440DRAFT_480940 [Plenodomus tracheiphilus IPT5]
MAEDPVFLAPVQRLLEQAFRIIERIRKAPKRQKALIDMLNLYESELKCIKAIIGIIEDENELNTPSVAAELVRMKDVQCKLADLLDRLDPKPKGKVDQFGHQITHESLDEKNLGVVMAEITQVKDSLVLCVQISNVGIFKTRDNQLVAHAEVIERIDLFLREEMGSCNGLRIATLLRGRRPAAADDGTIPLTRADLKSLTGEDNGDDSADETLIDDSEFPAREIPVETELLILRNSARHQALQINAALAEDIWKGVSRLVIQENVAEDQAVQVNGMTVGITKYLLAEQRERIAGPSKKPERKRRGA